jgi:hypothetical protein
MDRREGLRPCLWLRTVWVQDWTVEMPHTKQPNNPKRRTTTGIKERRLPCTGRVDHRRTSLRTVETKENEEGKNPGKAPTSRPPRNTAIRKAAGAWLGRVEVALGALERTPGELKE